MMRLATISPCYNEEEVLENSVARLTTLLNDLIQQGHISADSMMAVSYTHLDVYKRQYHKRLKG